MIALVACLFALALAQQPLNVRGMGASASYNAVKINEPYVAMTFDDGPHRTLTPELLDMLKERNIKVTFFVLGSLAKQYPAIVKRAFDEGHEIADHTWTHTLITKMSRSQLDHEIIDTANVIRSITGKWPRLFRPPYGGTSPALNRFIRTAYNLKTIIWNVDPEDWKRPGPDVVAQRLIDNARPGAIMLSHDIQPGTIPGMPKMFDTLLQKGFKFLTVSQLLDLAQIEDIVGNEHPGTSGDTINDGGVLGTGNNGRNSQNANAWAQANVASFVDPTHGNGGAAQPPRQQPVAVASQDSSPRDDCATGDRDLAKSTQEALIKLGHLRGAADGAFGPMSLASLNAFLGQNNRGSVSCLTRDAANAAIRAAEKPRNPQPEEDNGSPANGGANEECITGDREAARRTQEGLIKLGFLRGAADGAFGPMSLASLNAFQQKYNLGNARCLTLGASNAVRARAFAQ